MAVPDLASARRAAEEMVSAGVGTVLLFGSLARGEACEVSDIDLVAIYDDLGDYGERAKRRCALETQASAAAGCRVDVYVTDAPEWGLRSTEVPCSLEARIAGYAIELADSGDHASIDWDKEIGLPSEAAGELQHRFTDMSDALARLTANLRRGVDELDAAADDDLDEVAALEGVRFAAAMGEVHMVAESAAKALHIAHVETTPAHTHAIPGLMTALPGAVRDAIAAAAGRDVSLGELHQWRQGATGAADRPITGFDEAVLAAHAATAVRTAGLAADQCRPRGIADPVLASFDRRHRRAVAALDSPT